MAGRPEIGEIGSAALPLRNLVLKKKGSGPTEAAKGSTHQHVVDDWVSVLALFLPNQK